MVSNAKARSKAFPQKFEELVQGQTDEKIVEIIDRGKFKQL